MKNKNIILILLGILIVVVGAVGVSYAAWTLTLTQETTNKVVTGCFEVTLEDANPISLQDSFPIKDKEGEELAPYSFTIKNICESYASYQINLEVLDRTTFEDLSHMKLIFQEVGKSGTPKYFDDYEPSTPILSDAKSARKLEIGYLNTQEEKTYHLKLWMGYDTPSTEDFMNKVFVSKISVAASQIKEPPKSESEQNKEYIISQAPDNSLIEDDETPTHNLRYIGANPSNYIDIGDKDAAGNPVLWRIIGLMNQVEDVDGNTNPKLKLIRSTSIGNYSWDSSSKSINTGYGVNAWNESDLMKLLNPGYEENQDLNDANQTIIINNSLYWNRGTGNCYNNWHNETTTCTFTNVGLAEEAKQYISEVKWNIGSTTGSTLTHKSLLTSNFYEAERSENNGKICTSSTSCNDKAERTSVWTGYVGLMYPSDYGYATSGASTTDRTACLEEPLYTWSNSKVSDCKTNNWLYDSNGARWTITPAGITSFSSQAYRIMSSGYMDVNDVYYAHAILPVVYLKETTKIIDGNGSMSQPFKIEL